MLLKYLCEERVTLSNNIDSITELEYVLSYIATVVNSLLTSLFYFVAVTLLKGFKFFVTVS